MKTFIVLFLCITLAGCGHNILTVSEGTFLNVGYDPNNSKLGIQYVDGSQITCVEKDNNKLKIEKENTLDANGKITSKKTKIVYTIDEQITGSDANMEKAKK
jgi:hypothetical protein